MELTNLKNNYREMTPRSMQAFQLAENMIPGGVQGNIKFFEPYPLSFQKANGAWMTDVDGNTYVDYLLSFGALMLGHGHPVVKEAVEEAWNKYGTSSFGVPYSLETEMVEQIRALFPSIEQVRFTNSGLEATLLAIRLGLSFTGKTHIAKFDGHYHGGHERVLVSTRVPKASHSRPAIVAESMGLPEYFLDHTVVLPFNDISLCEQILREQKDKVGVVILEPVQSGYIPAEKDFMKQLRELTKELDILLVFDEVKTGFRVALGGAQEYYDVKPDLTALGKVLGGGFPIGAVGGRKDVLELSDPRRSTNPNEVVFHSGTFNGNPISLSAGLRTLQYLQEPGRFEQIVTTTNQLREGITSIGESYGFGVQTIGLGTIFNIIISKEESHFRPSNNLREALDYLLMSFGVFSKPLNRFSVSAAHGEPEVKHTLDAFERSFSGLAKIEER